ncbi:MAG: DUF6384 family protein [archaeon]
MEINHYEDGSQNPSRQDEFLRVVDILEQIRGADGAIVGKLEGRVSEDLKERLRDTYKRAGMDVKDSQIDAAIEQHNSGKWDFEPPEGGTTVARLYVNRGRVFWRRIVPAIALAGAAWLGWTGVKAGVRNHHEAQEATVEQAVEQAYEERAELEHSVERILSSPFALELPESESRKLNFVVESAQGQFDATDNFFTEFCPEGKADIFVTAENYADVRGRLENTVQIISGGKEI